MKENKKIVKFNQEVSELKSSEQLVCDNTCEWTRYPKKGKWYDGCTKCGKEIAN